MDELVWNAAYVADLLDNKLAARFGARLYSESNSRKVISKNYLEPIKIIS